MNPPCSIIKSSPLPVRDPTNVANSLVVVCHYRSMKRVKRGARKGVGRSRKGQGVQTRSKGARIIALKESASPCSASVFLTRRLAYSTISVLSTGQVTFNQHRTYAQAQTCRVSQTLQVSGGESVLRKSCNISLVDRSVCTVVLSTRKETLAVEPAQS